MRTRRLVLAVAFLALAACRAGAREGLPPAPPYVSKTASPSPAPVPVPAPTPAVAPLLGRVEYYQISDG